MGGGSKLWFWIFKGDPFEAKMTRCDIRKFNFEKWPKLWSLTPIQEMILKLNWKY